MAWKYDEDERIQLLNDLDLLDSDPEDVLNNIVQVASYICETPISLVSLVDENRQWFKAKHGLDADETPREFAFCAHAIKDEDIFIIENSFKDDRFKDNPLVTGDPNVVFYAGVPLKIYDRQHIGTLCVIGNEPKQLSEMQIKQLKKLSEQAMAYIEMRHQRNVQKKISNMLAKLHKLNLGANPDTDKLITNYLKMGLELFELEYAIQSKIVGNDYIVQNCFDENGDLQVGSVFELPGTYCAAVVELQKTVTYLEVGKIKELEGHPVYVNMKLESYISTPIWVDGDFYGTLNFSSKKVKKQNFLENERQFIEIIADMIGNRLKLNKREQFLNYTYDIIDETPLLISMLDAKSGKELYQNKAFNQMSKISYSDDFSTLSKAHPEWAAKRIQEIAIPKALKGGKWIGESAVLDAKGKEIPVLQTIVAHKDNNGETAFLSTIMQDITAQKEVEKQLKENEKEALKMSEMKTQFFANISHEIRTPMNGILGTLDLLSDTKLSLDQQDHLSTIQSCSDSLLVIINDVLDLSKIESEYFELEKTTFDIHKMIKESTDLYRGQVKDKGLKLSTEYIGDIPHFFEGDPVRMKQIMTNLVSNAIKFTNQGEVKVIIDSKKNVFNKYDLKISVRDSGIGIPKEKQKTVFEVFSQADASTTRHFGGTGLGLTICQKLANAMGGVIVLDSEEGKGSTFTFEVSLAESTGTVQTVIVENEGKELLSETYPHEILVAEDNLVNKNLIKSFLSKLGYSCDIAKNGQEAVDMAMQKNYSLILMDVQMPVLDGVVASKIIIEKMGNNAPIIVPVTANVFPEDKAKYAEAGMTSFISKPFSIQMFRDVIIECSAEKKPNNKKVA